MPISKRKRLQAQKGYEQQAQHRRVMRESSKEISKRDNNTIQSILKSDGQNRGSGIIEAALNKVFYPQHPPDVVQKRDEFKQFLETVIKKSSKLVPYHVDALHAMFKEERIKSVDTWEPIGKGRDTHLKSLAIHLFAKYRMPEFIWSVFTEEKEIAIELAPMVVAFANGGSLPKLIKGYFPFNKKQCHALVQTPSSYSFLKAIRRIQVKTHDGNERLFKAWCRTGPGECCLDFDREVFWDSVIAFLANNPMLDLNQVGPLVDYIEFRLREDPSFSMKGSTPMALIRGMEDWHNVLANKEAKIGKAYAPSGYKANVYKNKIRANGNYIVEEWRVDEILTSKELFREGKALNHCVYSYGWSIERGQCSIWSLSHDDGKRITIQVNNQNNKITQIRGKYNRKTDAQEFKIINKWANDNKLTIQTGW